jgi:hypothetical protein
MDEWKTIEPGVWKPEQKGDHIIGVLVNKTPKDEQSGLSARYYIENENGTFFLWGSAVIDDRMQYVKVGQKVRITFEGKTKNKRNQDVNLYTVEVADTVKENAYSSNSGTDIKQECFGSFSESDGEKEEDRRAF